MERRAAVELRARSNGRRLEGYAALFDVPARIDAFLEIIRPGAFSRSLKSNPDIVATADHNPAAILARTRSGTLRLAEDAKGLYFDLDVPDTSAGRDVLALAERGDLGGASFTFSKRRDGEKWDGTTRTLSDLDLHEIAIVSAFPAYDGTTVQARKRGLWEHHPTAAAARRWIDTL